MLKNDWTDAWSTPGNPEPLGMPLQGLVTGDGIRRTAKYAAVGECQKVAFNPVGQVVGQINEVESTRNVVFRLINEYVDALDRINSLMPDA
jgi:NAD(P)H-dependent flavin oxidoreductase YrpB (nitropropane dioxygenase family)